MGLAELVGLAGVPLIVALVQACKAWVRDERYWPLLALAWGLAINLFAAYALPSDWRQAIVYGVVAGLAAAGLYSAGKAPTKPEPPK